jgi:adenine deaminase
MRRLQRISGNIVDVLNSRIYPGTIEIAEGRIRDIIRDSGGYNTFILPGFIDAHVHIESSLLPPSEFARLSVCHGTVAVIADPHEIANVLGLRGIRYMINDAQRVPLKFYFGAPPCVPATGLETSGAVMTRDDIEELFKSGEAHFLSEVMDFPSVIRHEPSIMEKIETARRHNKPVDGHAPGLKGKDLRRYIGAGILTDHESIAMDEAVEKIRAGMKIQIREGSEARDFEALYGLLNNEYERCMLCCDDILPHDLAQRHIDRIVRMAIAKGIDIMKILRSACVNPVLHYNLDVGLLQRGDYADLVVVDNLQEMNIIMTVINGDVVAEHGKPLIPRLTPEIINNFHTHPKDPSDFWIRAKTDGRRINVIEVVDGDLITKRLVTEPLITDGYVVSDIQRDILKVTVVNRYMDRPPSRGFVRNFGLKKGAIAFSVGHDSHNITSVGVSDGDICRAVNLIIENKGGLSVVYDNREEILPLPIAGLMSDDNGFNVAERYLRLLDMAREMGTTLREPFVNLSFISLLVIPEIRLGDKGLFDEKGFRFIDLFTD